MEKKVSKIIRKMPFLWVKVEKRSDRKYIEKNALHCYLTTEETMSKKLTNRATGGWGTTSRPLKKFVNQALWNENYVDKTYDPNFLNILSNYIEKV